MNGSTLTKLDALERSLALPGRVHKRRANKLTRELVKRDIFQHLAGCENRWPRIASLVKAIASKQRAVAQARASAAR